MKTPITCTMALLLTSAALAGGGPSVARPAGTSVNPFGTTATAPMTMPVVLSDLQRAGTTLTFVTGRNIMAGTANGPVVTVVGPDAATSVVANTGGTLRRYTLLNPIRPGVPTPVRQIRLLPVAPVVLLPIQAPQPRPTTPVTVTPVTPVVISPVQPAPVQPAPAQPGLEEPISICHRTESATNPYVLITVSRNALDAHEGHGDLIPAPAEGCPTTVSDAAQPGTEPTPPVNDNDKISICHRTGSDTNPYNLISVSRSALDAHEGHGDLIPAPAEGCPTTVSDAAQPGTEPTPPANGNDKVDICHKTESDANPYNLISVSRDALDAHQAHGDIIPAPAEGCPTGTNPGNGSSN